MKPFLSPWIAAFVFASLTRLAVAEAPASPRAHPAIAEKVTVLGVETAPVSRALRSQLGLAPGIGLVVTSILEQSPAAAVLKPDDIVTKFADQVLVNSAQLGVLVRGKKDGDEVALTLVRGGQEQVVKVRLVAREMPKRPEFWWGRDGEAGDFLRRVLPEEVFEKWERWRGPDDLGGGPPGRIHRQKERATTILNLPKSTLTYTDEEGSLELKTADNRRTLTARDSQGKILFEGPISTPEERKQLPPQVARWLEKIGPDKIRFEPGADFKLRALPVPGAPTEPL